MDKVGSSDSDKDIDTNTDRGHEEDCCCKWEQNSYLVKTTEHLEFWWCQSFYWRPQWIEPGGASCDQGFYTKYCLSPLLHGSDPAVGGRD
jgi:hypothetical protein